MDGIKNLVNRVLGSSKNKYRVLINETFEMPTSFADIKLVNDIVSRQIVTNDKGVEVCLATFRVVFAEHISSQKEAFELCIEMNAKDKDKFYFLSCH